jgi:hypothetical protein
LLAGVSKVARHRKARLVVVQAARPAAHRRRHARKLLVLVVGILMAQAVRRDTERGPGDARLPEDIVEAAIRLLEGQTRIGERVLVQPSGLLRVLERLLLQVAVDGDLAQSSALRSALHFQVCAEIRRVGHEEPVVDDGQMGPTHDRLFHSQPERLGHE